MEPAWNQFDFALNITDVYEKKKQAMAAYQAVFSGQQAQMLPQVETADRYFGGLVGVKYAEIFRCRSPLLINDLNTVGKTKFG